LEGRATDPIAEETTVEKRTRMALLPVGLLGALLFAAQASVAQTKPVAEMKPSDGWSLHIDALKHFPSMTAHHWCKGNLAGGLTECQLFDSDAPDARLAGVEVVVDASSWKELAASERALWHYHKTEIPKVSATLPGLSAEEAAKVAKDLEETYGKIYLLWDPGRKSLATGRPTVMVIK
jgi:hypothetical protein